jgi:type I restriction-modification system DNA methylase subunit
MKDILKSLEAILRNGYSSFTIFNDWLDLMIFALQRDDEHYLEIVRQYKNDKEIGEREIDLFSNAFACLQMEMKKTNDDVLGQVYMQWNQNNRYRGQFFTPSHIASMMAQMLSPKGRILDPCCGSGIMLIEAIKTMANENLDKSVFVGQDIDLTCVKMCALNLLFFNVNGFVVWGDSLMMECKKVYETSRSYLGGSIRELRGDDFESFKDRYIGALTNIQSKVERDNNIESQESEDKNFNKQLMLF